MNSIFKKLLAVCLLLSVMLIACSCGGSNNNSGDGNTENGGSGSGDDATDKATYKVTVVDQDNKPLAGATVEISVSSIKHSATTDNTGVATFTNVKKLPYSAKVTLNGYAAGKSSYSFALESTELKVELTKKVTYKITVVDTAGSPLAGANVQLCVGDICKLPVATGDDGVATFANFDEANYTIKVTFDGNTYEVPYGFEEGSYELTVEFAK